MLFVLLPLIGGVALSIAGAHRFDGRAANGAALVADAWRNQVAAAAEPEEVLRQYCMTCHNARRGTAGLAFDTLDVTHPGAHGQIWEKVIGRLRAGTMPPGGSRRPDAETYDAVASWLEDELDKAWAANPNPGRINALHRLNRTEYGNAIRDLFDLDIDVQPLLVGDETADGSFDNFASVLSFTPTHLERYASVARQVTRLATGLPPIAPETRTYEVPLHIMQDDYRGTDLPLGSRGGVAVTNYFPASGEYEVEIRLRRQYQDYIMGMGWAQEAELRVDGRLVDRFTVGGNAPGTPSTRSYAGAGNSFGDPEWEVFMHVADDGLKFRISAEAGPSVLGVTFIRQQWEPEFVPQPLQRGRVLTNDEQYMEYAAIHSVEISGPYEMSGAPAETPSRRKIFSCHPDRGADEVACATEILSRLARSAFRRPVGAEDVAGLLEFYREGRAGGRTFDSGIQFALERLLVDPEFLFRVYREPTGVREGEAYPLSDLEVASRLSFFLWSGIPDEQLLAAAERGTLTEPETLAAEVRRMLADPRALRGLVDDFTAQWLNLRLLAEKLADPDIYPDFDDNLLEAFEQETKMFVASTIEDDASVRRLLDADYTFANERLARHYGIPGVYGTRFRRVTLPDPTQRGGLLGHGSLLSVSSYPDRTSPVLRGKWLLDNMLGAPTNPPPPNVDTSLDEETGSTPRTIRERLEQHRSDQLCATCHSVMDPLGFALESFDATGGWRDTDTEGRPIDNVGTWPTGLEIEGFSGLRAMLLEHHEQFVGSVTRKLMAYALGRPLEFYDQPSVRKIVREAAADDYAWSSIVQGIVRSPAFLMRTASGTAAQQ
jgi:mono/diheme cytochrome c family protein